MELGVQVVPGVQREFYLGNVVFAAAMSALLHLLDFHDTDGAEVERHLAVQTVNQFLTAAAILNTQELENCIV